MTHTNKCFIIRKHKGCDCIEKIDLFIVVCFNVKFKKSLLSVCEDDEEYISYPGITINTKDVCEYNISNINNKHEVMRKVYNDFKNRYISNENMVKKIYNIDTRMYIEIWKKGSLETFGNDKYYKDMPEKMKIYKIATMEYLAKLIKYAKRRCKDARNYHYKKSKVIYSYLTIDVKIDNVVYKINMDIRRSPDGINRFYIHSLENKKEASLS